MGQKRKLSQMVLILFEWTHKLNNNNEAEKKRLNFSLLYSEMEKGHKIGQQINKLPTTITNEFKRNEKKRKKNVVNKICIQIKCDFGFCCYWFDRCHFFVVAKSHRMGKRKFWNSLRNGCKIMCLRATICR